MAKQAVDRSTQELILGEKWDMYERVKSDISNLLLDMEELYRVWLYYKKDLADLKAQGINYAGTTWKNGKYLYLVYPDEGNGRRREYIGADEEKCKAALDALDRGIKYDQKVRELNGLEAKMQRYYFAIKR